MLKILQETQLGWQGMQPIVRDVRRRRLEHMPSWWAALQLVVAQIELSRPRSLRAHARGHRQSG